MVARSGVLRSDTIPKALLRVVVGDDGGTERSDTFPNFRFRAAVGDDGGTERSGSGATPSELST